MKQVELLIHSDSTPTETITHADLYIQIGAGMEAMQEALRAKTMTSKTKFELYTKMDDMVALAKVGLTNASVTDWPAQ